MSNSSTVKADLYEQVTQSIIRAMEEGAGQYVMPWHSLACPCNAVSCKSYRGINTLLLCAAAQQANYHSNEWATYRQWKELGGQVRKGEKSTVIVFWKFFDRTEESEEADEDGTEATGKRARCMSRAYWVFNAAQVEGAPVKPHEILPESERIAQAESFFSALPGTVIYEDERAYYSAIEDAIHMPEFARFKSAPHFYSVLCHERSHWSGAPSRLNRDLSGRFGDEKYAMEELIAELTSAMVCSQLGLPLQPRKDHAPYVENWLGVLKHDKRAIFTAASKAQEVANYLQQLAGVPRAA